MKILKNRGFGFIRPTEPLPERFTTKDVYFNLEKTGAGFIPSVGDSVVFILATRSHNAYVKPSAQCVWPQDNEEAKTSKSGSPDGYNSDESTLHIQRRNEVDDTTELSQSGSFKDIPIHNKAPDLCNISFSSTSTQVCLTP